MYRICEYVCIHIGRVRLSNVYTLHVLLTIKDNNNNNKLSRFV